jgi:hypothetical protein
MSRAGDIEIVRRKQSKPTMVVRIDDEVGRMANIVAGFENKPLGVYISEQLGPIVEKALLLHAQKVVDSNPGPPSKRSGGKS